jgi:26S proteasome regulatory subunit T4
MAATTDTVREKALQDYRKKLLEHKELEARLKESKFRSLR